jgi:biopolymer transport protein ExbD
VPKNLKNLKTPAIVTAAVLAVILILVVIFLIASQKNKHTDIELPAASAQTQAAASSAPQQKSFAEVTPDNVQEMLKKSLSRPSAYHQVFTIERTSGAATRSSIAEIWVSGDKFRADLTEDTTVKTVLTDGKTLYIWYNDDQSPVSVKLDGSITRDDLAGIPTYEDLLAIPRADIDEADFVTLPDDAEQQCIFMNYRKDGFQRYAWVSLQTGLLCRQTTLLNDEQVYSLSQTQIEVLTDGDESLSDVFLLPDGKDPFTQTSDTQKQGS